MDRLKPGTRAGEGINKWLLLALCSSANFLVYFHRVTPAVMVNELMAEFGGSAAIIGLLSSAYFYTYTLSQIPVGFLSDRISPRYLIGLGIVLAGFSSAAFGMSENLTAAIIFRALTGLGVSAVLVPSYKILGVAFGERFMTANGILMASGAFGALGATSPLVLIMQEFGWRAAFYIIAAVSMLVGLLCICLIKAPWETGGSRAASGFDFRTFAKLLPVALVPGVIAFFKYGPLVSYQGLWGVPFLMDVYGMAKLGASQLILLISLSMIAAGLSMSFITGSLGLGPKKLAIAMASLFAACWIPLLLPASGLAKALLYVSAALMGGSDIVVLVLMNNAVRTTTDVSVRGTVLGMINSITLAGGALYQPMMGLFVNGTPVGYTRAFSLGFAGASFAAFLVYRYMNSKPHETPKA